jgi:hypothetical protein
MFIKFSGAFPFVIEFNGKQIKIGVQQEQPSKPGPKKIANPMDSDLRRRFYRMVSNPSMN